MISDFITAAMATSEFEILPEDRTFYGRIPACPGVWASEATLTERQNELKGVLEDWLILALRRNVQIPVFNDIDLNLRAA